MIGTNPQTPTLRGYEGSVPRPPCTPNVRWFVLGAAASAGFSIGVVPPKKRVKTVGFLCTSQLVTIKHEVDNKLNIRDITRWFQKLFYIFSHREMIQFDDLTIFNWGWLRTRRTSTCRHQAVWVTQVKQPDGNPALPWLRSDFVPRFMKSHDFPEMVHW